MQQFKRFVWAAMLAICAAFVVVPASVLAAPDQPSFYAEPQAGQPGVVIPTLRCGYMANFDDQSIYADNADCVQLFTEGLGTVVQVQTRALPVGGFTVRASGFLLTADGKVATVLSRLSIHDGGIRVVTMGGHRYIADLVAQDNRWDVAILQIRGIDVERFPAAKLGASQTAAPSILCGRRTDKSHNAQAFRAQEPHAVAISYPQTAHRAFMSPGWCRGIAHLPFVFDPYGKIPDGMDSTRDMLLYRMHCQHDSIGAPVFDQQGLVVGMVESCVDPDSVVYVTPVEVLRQLLSRLP